MYINVSVAAYRGTDDKQFSYRYSGEEKIGVGRIIEVPFGRQASLGIVRAVDATKPQRIKVSETKRVLDLPPLTRQQIELAVWMTQYYAAPASSVWQLLLPKNAASKPRKKFTSRSTKTTPITQLTADQHAVLNEIASSAKPVLLEGVMGSGKTEIYFHLIDQQIKDRKSSILLMPEIFLTNQMITRAKKHFGEKLLITHSAMTAAQRRHFWDQCSQLSQSSPVIVLGPRSALFAPVQNLGLIIIDECHEQSYKQDASPRYQTEYVAARLAKLTKAKLVLGSATPSITTRYLADLGKLKLVKLHKRAVGSKHPAAEVVDMTKDKSIISKTLALQLQQCLDDKHSALLYLNRRGTAPLFMCGDCGQGFECKNCGVNLHFHADTMRLICHVCSYSLSPPAACSKCGSTELRGQGHGTKAVEEALASTYPDSKVARIDRDSAKDREFTDILKSIESHKVDIIVGTQMLGRGLDLERLQLVGIINADYDLLNSDFNGRERAYQLISQAAGRAGRRDIQGKVVIQTRNPANSLIRFITENDFEAFYQDELKLRKKYSYPPFVYLLKLECGFINESFGKKKADELKSQLSANRKLQVLGPVKAYPFIRRRKKYWKIIIKSKNRNELLKVANSLDKNWIINLDPYGIS